MDTLYTHARVAGSWNRMAAYSFPALGRGRSRMGGSGGADGGGGGADGAGRALGAAFATPPASCSAAAFLRRAQPSLVAR